MMLPSPQTLSNALHDLQVACKVDQIKLSDYGVDPARFGEYADNARTTMGGLFGLTHAKFPVRISSAS